MVSMSERVATYTCAVSSTSKMGQTPRDRVTQIPLPTRSTEAGADCEGRTYLSYLREDQVRPASFFILGDVLHRAIQSSIVDNWTLDRAKAEITTMIDQALEPHRNTIIVEGMQRSVASMPEDADRMITNWFAHVHPDSDKRHPFYDDYQWPPATEVPFYKANLGTRFPVWGSVDTLFAHKDNVGTAIVDWKSGVKKPPTQFQLDYYRFGMEAPQAVAAYHMLDRVRKQSIVLEADPYPGDLYIREAISSTERTKQQVVAGVLPKFSPGWQCNYCPVQHICPADGDTRNRSKNERDFKKVLAQAEALEWETDLVL